MIETLEVFDVPGVRDVYAVLITKSIGSWSGHNLDNVWTLPR